MNRLNKAKALVLISLSVLLSGVGCASTPTELAEQGVVSTSVLSRPAISTPQSNASPDPTDKFLLFARADDLYRADAEGNGVEQLTTGGRLGWGMATGDEWQSAALSAPPRVSPDGRRIAFSPDGDTLVVVDVSGPVVEPLALPGSAVFAWSPDSLRLAYAANAGSRTGGQLMIYDVDAAAAGALPVGLVADVAALAWSPDGHRVAFGCCFAEDYTATGEYLGTMTGELRVVDLATGKAETVGPLWRSVAGGVQSFCWTAGNQVATVEQGSMPNGHCSTPPDPGLAPDGRRFYLSAAQLPAAGAPYQLVVAGADGVELWRRDLPANFGPVAWSPDGRSIFLDDTRAVSPIWRVRADGTGEPEVVVEDGYLLAVVEGWR